MFSMTSQITSAKCVGYTNCHFLVLKLTVDLVTLSIIVREILAFGLIQTYVSMVLIGPQARIMDQSDSFVLQSSLASKVSSVETLCKCLKYLG